MVQGNWLNNLSLRTVPIQTLPFPSFFFRKKKYQKRFSTNNLVFSSLIHIIYTVVSTKIKYEYFHTCTLPSLYSIPKYYFVKHEPLTGDSYRQHYHIYCIYSNILPLLKKYFCPNSYR